MNDELISVEAMSDRAHPRQLAKVAIANRKSSFPPLGVAQVHDENRVDLDRPAQALDVNKAVRSATYRIPNQKLD